MAIAAWHPFKTRRRVADLVRETICSMSGSIPPPIRFDPCIAHHTVPANRRGFRARRVAVCDRIPAVLPHSAAEIARQSILFEADWVPNREGVSKAFKQLYKERTALRGT